jgi:hypothetical protein
MGECHEIFCFGFFHKSVSAQPQSYSLGPFRIVSKIRGDIRKQRCTTSVNDTGSKIAAGINDTGGKFATGIISMTPAANFATCLASVVDTGGKFATGICMKKPKNRKSRDTVPLK